MAEKSFYRKLGKVVNVVGLTIESAGPDSKLGDLCRILPDAEGARPIMAEVVGFRDKKTLLMPYDSVDGIGLGCVVENTGDPLKVTVNDKLLGKTVNGLGVPIDGEMINGAAYPVEAAPPDPMSRTIIDQVLPLGVKAVDGMITVGKGQRIGIFAGSGVGKSTLMGMFARNTKADINVIALIGERGREVREFIERDLGEEGMRRSVVVVATSDRPALERNKAAKTATAIAEYFRDQGRWLIGRTGQSSGSEWLRWCPERWRASVSRPPEKSIKQKTVPGQKYGWTRLALSSGCPQARWRLMFPNGAVVCSTASVAKGER